MGPLAHKAARCQNRENCTGPGCRLRTGKTRRKATKTGRPFKRHYSTTEENA